MPNKDTYTRDDQTRFTMRINTALMDKIKKLAVQNKRSAAKEIEFILESYFVQNAPKE